MATIQIRDVPDDVHAKLRARAASEGLSLSAYLLREATRLATQPTLREVLAEADDRDWGVEPGVATAIIRADRDRRS